MAQNDDSKITRFAAPAVWFWLAFAVVTFWILDRYSLSLGDDFAYMFTDSRTHAFDGHRVSSLSDCFTTQLQHYTTTNGRFLVHVLDMIMINYVPEVLYRIINAGIFGLMYFGLLVLGFKKPRESYNAAVLLALIWWTIPDAGTVMLSLISYSVNYLWSAAAIVFLLILWRRCLSLSSIFFSLTCFYSLICGTLQESFSIPICIAITVEFILRYKLLSRRTVVLRILFLIGSAILICAPGNFAHFASGGGMGGASLLHKFSSMLLCFLASPISILLIVVLIMALRSRSKCKLFIKENRFLFTAIAGAVLFASVTFTAPRQFFAPSIFAIIILCRAIDTRRKLLQSFSKAINITLLVLLSLFFSAVLSLRSAVESNHKRYVTNATYSSAGFTYSDVSQSPYNTHPLLWKIFGNFAPDPWECSHFSFPFDSFSRKGLSRVLFNSPDSIKAVFPYPVEHIQAQCPPIPVKSDSIYTTYPLDAAYNAVTVYGPQPAKIKNCNGSGARFEQCYTSEGVEIIVVPSCVKNIKIIYPKSQP